MQVEYNAIRAIAILVTTALLLNAMAPTLAHAAVDLAEINANTLVRDAYVQVIYRDLNGPKKTARGWIDAIGETSFTIREGGFRDKKIVAYDKVVSVIMSDESTVPAKQMNEVNRFIRTMGNTQQAIQWAETVKVMPRGQIDLSKIAKGLYAHVVYTSEDKKKKVAVGKITDKDSDHLMIQEAKYRSGRYRKIAYSDIDILAVAKYQQDIAGWKNAGQAIQKLREKTVSVMSRGQIDPSRILKGWYAQVIYTSEDEKKKTIAGWILNKDVFRISVRQVIKDRIEIIKDRRDRMTTITIAYDDIDTLVVAKQWRDIERYRESGAKYNTKVRFKAPSVSKRRIVGKLVEVTEDTLVIQEGRTFFQVPLSSISNLEVSIGQHRNIGKGLLAGVGLGSATVAVFFRHAEHIDETTPDDSLDALAIALGGMVIGGLILVIFTFSGAMTKSDKWVEVPPQRFNLSVAPISTKGLHAALTFNF